MDGDIFQAEGRTFKTVLRDAHAECIDVT